MNISGEARSEVPDYLASWVLAKRLDEKTALRIELVRRARQIDGSVNGSFHPELARSIVRKDLTFERFSVDLNNVLAVEVAKEIVEDADWSQTYNLLYFYGEHSAGKTHLLNAMANAMHPQEARLINTRLLLDEYGRTSTLNAKMGLRKWLVSGDLLLLDDIQFCAEHKDFQMEILSIIAHTISQHRSVVVTSDVPPGSLAEVDPLLVSLLTTGDVANVGMCKSPVTEQTVKRNHDNFLLDHPQCGTERVPVNGNGVPDRDMQGQARPQFTSNYVFSDVIGGTWADTQEIILDPKGVAEQAVVQAPIAAPKKANGKAAEDFKRMVTLAESEEEELRAIESAIAERIRQLSQAGQDSGQLEKLREALLFVQNGDLREAVARMAP
jgi:hypothetical protein